VGRLPLHWAAKQNHIQVVMFLVTAATALLVCLAAIVAGSSTHPLLCCQVGELENSDYELVHAKDSEGKTPLQVRVVRLRSGLCA
jgi:ankyrin repeat protein